jgi:hypothetical protein
MAMQVVLLIFSGLLFVFSRTKQDEAVQILLSLAEVFVIIYQVSCLLFQAGCTDHLQREYIYRYTALHVRVGFDGLH